MYGARLRVKPAMTYTNGFNFEFMQLQSFKLKSKIEETDYPFFLDLIRNLEELRFTKPVTIFVGENGSGKSTLLEALAVATDLPIIGVDNSTKDETLEPARRLAKNLQLTWSIRNHRGFFMRAEDFFGFQRQIARNQIELRKQKQEFSEKYTGYGKLLSTSAMQNQINNLEKRYGENPDAFSHGESFLNLFSQRFVPEGLYILDEPEVPLSPIRQMSLISMIKEQVETGAQFIIATHSPMLMAFPDAEIYEIREGVLNLIKYEDIESVQLMKDFLQSPKVFLERL